MSFEVNERLEGLKYNIDFGKRGWGYTGGRDKYVHYAKKAILQSLSTLLSLIVVFRTTKSARDTVRNKTTLDTYLSSGIPSIFKANKH